jgi:hypothetical protein
LQRRVGIGERPLDEDQPAEGAITACAARTLPPRRPSATTAVSSSAGGAERCERAEETWGSAEMFRFSRMSRTSGCANRCPRESTTYADPPGPTSIWAISVLTALRLTSATVTSTAYVPTGTARVMYGSVSFRKYTGLT